MQPSIFQSIPGLLALSSTRHGGQSPMPYGSMNLGLKTGDSFENIEANRQLLAQAYGFDWNQVAYSLQVHKADILYTHTGGAYEGYDAVVTDTQGVFVGVYSADCAPVLIFDKKNGISAAAHAGWRGAAQNIVAKTFSFMQTKFGSTPQDCLAYIGPCIGAAVFEVGEEVVLQFDPRFSKPKKETGKYLLDLKACISQQMCDIGFEKKQIEISSVCTFSDTKNYFSHRKEKGTTGRMLSIIGLQ